MQATRHRGSSPAALSAARFFEDGRRRNSDWLGFWSHDALTDYIERGGFWSLEENGDHVAAAIVGGRIPTCKVHAIYTRPDARRLRLALALLDEIDAHARHRGFARLRARVACDLPDFAFWSAAGFEIARIVPGGRRRSRSIALLVREAPASQALPLFAMHRGRSSSANRRLNPVSPILD